ncbi:MAG: pyruvate, phosphate dikinase [Deltaproteobacteria bacterium]|nr:pyruvate, phosphate dikinase [Deltaproteobacteria bacterium]
MQFTRAKDRLRPMERGMIRFIKRLFGRAQGSDRKDYEEPESQRKYFYFKDLLKENHRSLEIVNGLEQLALADRPFTYEEVLERCQALMGVVCELVENLNAMSGGRYPELFAVAERIGIQVLGALSRRRRPNRSGLVLPLAALSRENAEQVGGKAANLGEIINRVGLPTPRGFVVTAFACHQFLWAAGLVDFIKAEFQGLDIEDTDRLEKVCQAVQERILAAPLPDELERRIKHEAVQLARDFGSDVRMAVRSSATGEDSELSFAGQYATILNVREENVLQAYRQVVASMYSPRAVFYRRSVGYRDQDVIMCVLCLNMIRAKASGVLYTLDPNVPGREVMIVGAVWGLGVGVVDGSMPTDHWEIDKTDLRVLEARTATKPVRVVMGSRGGMAREAVEPEMVDRPCLEPAQLAHLVEYGLSLERHYKQPLDIEWALDPGGRLFVIQARPLNPKDLERVSAEAAIDEVELSGHEILVSGGSTASAGAASGPAFILGHDQHLGTVPEGVILVTAQTTPRLVPLMHKVRGIVTEVGSVTGHMASVAREFALPTLVGVEGATSTLPHGEEITLDATNGVVYSGRIDSLVRTRPAKNMMKGGPLFQLVQDAMKKISPLNLYDPRLESFRPEGCLTVHDLVRYIHEMSMVEMFHLGDEIGDEDEWSAVLETKLPLKIHILDLGSGFLNPPRDGLVSEEDIASRPFRALLKGMSYPGLHWLDPVGLHLTEFSAIMSLASLNDPQRDAFPGVASYAIVARRYVNYSARLGYHYVTVDAFCGDNLNDNYITFSFKGGATDAARRTRLARMIAAVLRPMGLRVEIRGDMLRAEIRKYDSARMEDKLDQIGRLMGSVRLLDMVLVDEDEIPWYADQFRKGNYSFRK